MNLWLKDKDTLFKIDVILVENENLIFRNSYSGITKIKTHSKEEAEKAIEIICDAMNKGDYIIRIEGKEEIGWTIEYERF